MNTDEIAAYLVDRALMRHPTIRLLGKGEANINYLAEDDKNQYVIRVARNDVPGHSRFEAEHHFMSFIESLGIEFASRSIHYDDSSHNIHVVSYVEGRDASVVDLDDSLKELFIHQIKILNNISYSQYRDWCTNTEQSSRQPQTLAARNNVNIVDRLEVMRDNAHTSDFAKRVLAWAEPKVEVLYEAGRAAHLKTTFLHNDLRWNEGGGNLRIHDEKLIFIDWELSGFFEDVAPEIGDVLGSIPSTASDKSLSGKLYQTYIASEKDIEPLNKSIKYGVLSGKLGNPLWAAERYFDLNKSNHPEVERYVYLTERGMEDAEFFFKQPFDQWF